MLLTARIVYSDQNPATTFKSCHVVVKFSNAHCPSFCCNAIVPGYSNGTVVQFERPTPIQSVFFLYVSIIITNAVWYLSGFYHNTRQSPYLSSVYYSQLGRDTWITAVTSQLTLNFQGGLFQFILNIIPSTSLPLLFHPLINIWFRTATHLPMLAGPAAFISTITIFSRNHAIPW